ncbi:MAG: HD domain-containing protein [Spirochaetales bacterium]|nr:HD domain-containing protein [Spirochaetales bacterium]
MGEREKILSHLENEYTNAIRDPLWKHIYLSSSLIKIINCREFQNLHQIKQLGPTYLVYPGATHTRFNHSLGVFHIARKMILNLVKHPDCPSLTLYGVKAFLCAALFHDLGHYPYAHSLKELRVRSHESLTGEKICRSRLSTLIKKVLDIDPGAVAAIIDKKAGYKNLQHLSFYRHLLSGVLDPDKLDYLNRDAYFCGIPYGRQDVDYILDDIQPHPEKGLLITEQGLSSVESLLFSKYVMYKTIYWHKTVRIATAMVKKALLLAMLEGIITPEQLYDLNDYTLFSLADTINFKPLELLSFVSNRTLYKQVYYMPFDPANKSHILLQNLDFRISRENRIAKEITKITGSPVNTEDIIIDIPEDISFEIDVPIRTTLLNYNWSSTKLNTFQHTLKPDCNVQGTHHSGGNIQFDKSGSVFTPETIANFVKSLRHISLSIKRNKALLNGIKKVDIPGIIEHDL